MMRDFSNVLLHWWGAMSAPLSPLIQRLVSTKLVTTERMEAVRAALPSDAQGESLMQALIAQGDLTAWQAEQIGKGNTAFFLDNDRYVIRSQIGQGGMGAVYRATHVTMNRDVALKIIDPRKVTDKSLVDRFRREVQVSAKLQHEHIVQAHDVGVHGGVSFLVLEFVEGADLS